MTLYQIYIIDHKKHTVQKEFQQFAENLNALLLHLNISDTLKAKLKSNEYILRTNELTNYYQDHENG